MAGSFEFGFGSWSPVSLTMTVGAAYSKGVQGVLGMLEFKERG